MKSGFGLDPRYFHKDWKKIKVNAETNMNEKQK